MVTPDRLGPHADPLLRHEFSALPRSVLSALQAAAGFFKRVERARSRDV
jgi:hypothetical protein